MGFAEGFAVGLLEFLRQQAGSLLGLTANSDDFPIDLKYPSCRYWSKVMVIIQTSRWPDYRLFFSIPGMKTHLKHGMLVLFLGSETSHQRKCDVVSACELFKVPMVDDSEWEILEKYVSLYQPTTFHRWKRWLAWKFFSQHQLWNLANKNWTMIYSFKTTYNRLKRSMTTL